MFKASLLRRLGALLYDSLVSVAIVMLVTACWLPVYGGHAVPPGNMAYRVSLVVVVYLYFAYCWHRGQTLGMRAWRLHITNLGGGPVSFPQALIRFLAAPIGVCAQFVGYPVHEIWSSTQIRYQR